MGGIYSQYKHLQRLITNKKFNSKQWNVRRFGGKRGRGKIIWIPYKIRIMNNK